MSHLFDIQDIDLKIKKLFLNNIIIYQEKDELRSLTKKLEDQVYQLQQELQWHLNNGCKIAHHHKPIHSRGDQVQYFDI